MSEPTPGNSPYALLGENKILMFYILQLYCEQKYCGGGGRGGGVRVCACEGRGGVRVCVCVCVCVIYVCVSVCVKFQALVYDILPSTTAVFS